MAESGFASHGNPTVAFVESVANTTHTFSIAAPTTLDTPVTTTTTTSTKVEKRTDKDQGGIVAGSPSLTKIETVFCGSTAGVVSRFVIAPLDVVKIRLQMQTQRKTLPKVLRRNSFPGSTAQIQHSSTVKSRSGVEARIQNTSRSNAPPRYRGMFSGIATIAREEGIKGLWKGNMAAEYLYLTYGGIQFLIYQQTKAFLSWTGELSARRAASLNLGGTPLYLIHTVANSSAAQSFISGATAGIMATACTYPFDLLRTRFAVQRDVKIYTSVPQAFQHIFRKEGISGFYKGMSPALIQVIPYMGVMFGSYDALKQLAAWLKTNSKIASLSQQDSKSELSKEIKSIGQILLGLEDMLCGATAGVISKTTVYPLDMVRKRLQVQGSDQQKANMGVLPSSSRSSIKSSTIPKAAVQVLPTSAWKSMVQIVSQEGYLALYKGLLPGLLKAAPASAVTFLVFSQMGAFVEQVRRPHQE
ncbi:mitochondrial thiamine pyrophosphate transporter [Mortierella sp. AD011]|nr:mitochondrial thiamine pyrophosphate transporter [Mortierella sp. AD010]KAF9401392.1 mitochondrial thiamine pyrophosphate transporter [Mortierella sp. AD011]